MIAPLELRRDLREQLDGVGPGARPVKELPVIGLNVDGPDIECAAPRCFAHGSGQSRHLRRSMTRRKRPLHGEIGKDC
jgi:hypothetical protein